MRLALRDHRLCVARCLAIVATFGGTLCAQESLPTRATVTEVKLPFLLDGESSLSPSGQSRLARLSQNESFVQWALQRDGRVYRLNARVSELHDRQPVGWRHDEMAVVIQGKFRRKTPFGTSHEVWFSVLDFAAGTVEEFDPDEYELLPRWSPAGNWVAAFKQENRDSLVIIDPSADEPEASERPAASLPPDDDIVAWASAGRLPGVVRFSVQNLPGRIVLRGGEFRQDVVDETPDHRFCLTEDDGLSHGQGDSTTPPWNVFDFQTSSCTPLPQPAGLTDMTDAQISDDGNHVLAVWREKDSVTALGIIAVDDSLKSEDWVLLHRWGSTETITPHRYVQDGELAWNGTDTAWIISQSGTLIRISLDRE